MIEEFSNLFLENEPEDRALASADERHTFRTSCRISHTLGYSFLRKCQKYVSEGRFLDSLQTVSALGPVALSVAPYLAAFSTQHKDDGFLDAVEKHFIPADRFPRPYRRKAWLTDTFTDVNGVSRTIQTMGALARQAGKPLTIVTCLDEVPKMPLEIKNFRPVGTFPIPEYESLELGFPPFMEIIEYLERHRFDELIISTPGLLGLVGLGAAKLLGRPSVGIYHTDFPRFVRCATRDHALEDLTWQYMLWFYTQMDKVLVPSEYYRQQLIHHGFDAAKLAIMARGVDLERFNPAHRDDKFWPCHGLNGAFKFIYVGRVSLEKNLHLLVEAFEQLHRRAVPVNLAIVGDGPALNELKARCKSLPVVFTGFLDGPDLAAAYASADAMVFPSTTDTFGNAVLEAQASGLPAIVSNQGGPQDLVASNNSGLVIDVTQPGALAEAMERLCTDARLRDEFRANALQNAAERRWDEVFHDFWNQDFDRSEDFGICPPAETSSTTAFLSQVALELDLP